MGARGDQDHLTIQLLYIYNAFRVHVGIMVPCPLAAAHNMRWARYQRHSQSASWWLQGSHIRKSSSSTVNDLDFSIFSVKQQANAMCHQQLLSPQGASNSHTCVSAVVQAGNQSNADPAHGVQHMYKLCKLEPQQPPCIPCSHPSSAHLHGK